MMDLHPTPPLSHSNGKLIFKPQSCFRRIIAGKKGAHVNWLINLDKVDKIPVGLNQLGGLTILLHLDEMSEIGFPFLSCIHSSDWLQSLDVSQKTRRKKKHEHLLVLFFIPLLFSVWFQLSELSWIELISSELICPNVRTIMLPQNYRTGTHSLGPWSI